MKKRTDKNSATSAVVGFVGAINDRIPLPAGVELRSEAELIIWHQFTRARARGQTGGTYFRLRAPNSHLDESTPYAPLKFLFTLPVAVSLPFSPSRLASNRSL